MLSCILYFFPTIEHLPKLDTMIFNFSFNVTQFTQVKMSRTTISSLISLCANQSIPLQDRKLQPK